MPAHFLLGWVRNRGPRGAESRLYLGTSPTRAARRGEERHPPPESGGGNGGYNFLERNRTPPAVSYLMRLGRGSLIFLEGARYTQLCNDVSKRLAASGKAAPCQRPQHRLGVRRGCLCGRRLPGTSARAASHAPIWAISPVKIGAGINARGSRRYTCLLSPPQVAGLFLLPPLGKRRLDYSDGVRVKHQPIRTEVTRIGNVAHNGMAQVGEGHAQLVAPTRGRSKPYQAYFGAVQWAAKCAAAASLDDQMSVRGLGLRCSPSRARGGP